MLQIHEAIVQGVILLRHHLALSVTKPIIVQHVSQAHIPFHLRTPNFVLCLRCSGCSSWQKVSDLRPGTETQNVTRSYALFTFLLATFPSVPLYVVLNRSGRLFFTLHVSHFNVSNSYMICTVTFQQCFTFQYIQYIFYSLHSEFT